MKDFEAQISKLLELTNVSVWDGQVLKEREQKIRDSALILAGQCIALFLYNLSQSQLAIDTAITQTQGWWHPKIHRHGLRKRQILTVGNVLVTLILPYVVTRTEKNDKNKSEGQGFCPFLEWLGMSGDGAEWIWIHIPPLLTRLGCPTETYQLLDFYHVTQHLKAFADVAFSEETQSKEWFKKARKTLKKGNAKSLINQMNEFIALASGERCQIMVGRRNYQIGCLSPRAFNL